MPAQPPGGWLIKPHRRLRCCRGFQRCAPIVDADINGTHVDSMVPGVLHQLRRRIKSHGLDDLLTGINRMKANGATRIAILKHDAPGKAQLFATGAPAAAFATALSTSFNARMASNLQGENGVTLADNRALLIDAPANPGKYDLTNITTSACNPFTGANSFSLTCASAALVAPEADRTDLFADTVHYTSRANKIISGFVLSVITPVYLKQFFSVKRNNHQLTPVP